MGRRMKSGQRDDLVTIERNGGSSEDDFGAVTESWATLTTAWAQVVYCTGQERREAGLEGADQTATFRVLADATTLGVTTADRIVFDGDNYDIVSAVPLDRDGVEWTAIKRASQ